MRPPTLPLLVFLALLAFPIAARSDAVTDLMERGRWKEARAAVAALGPDAARTHYLKARVQIAFNQLDQALVSAEKAVALEPRNADYHYQVSEVCGVMAQRAGKVKAFGLARRLRKEAEQAVALDPKHLEAREILVHFFSLAPGLIGGDKKKAAALAEEIARLSPARGAIQKAEIALRAKDEALAEKLYLQAIEADASSYGARMALCRIYAGEKRNQWSLVEKHAKAALANDPGRSGAYAVLAGLYAHQERWNDLDAILADAGRAIRGNLSPQYQAARILIVEHRDSTRAERLLRQYVAVEPEGGSPTVAHARWRLGQALEQQGRKTEAIAELEAASKLDPDFDPLKKDLKRIKKG
jgi:tetratricopeptide (TPR) repeat protein